MIDEGNILERINSQMQKIQLPHPNNQLLLFSGQTGSGKSSLINYLLGNSMKFEKKNGKYLIEKVNPNQKGPIIGNTANSQTRSPASYQWVNDKQLFDLPGHDDTGGIDVQIINAYVTKKVFQKGFKVKLVLVVSIHRMEEARGEIFFENIGRLEKLMGSDFQALHDSLHVVITKVPEDYEKSDVAETLAEKLKVNSQLISNHAENLLNHTIKSGKVHVFRRPDHQMFGSELDCIKGSLTNTPAYTLKNNGEPSLSQGAIQKILTYQNQTMSEYNRNIAELEQKIEIWVNQQTSSSNENDLQNSRKKLQTIKNEIKTKNDFSFIVNFNIGYSKQEIQQRFEDKMKAAEFSFQFTKKKYDLKKDQLQQILNSYERRCAVKLEEVREKKRLQLLRIEQERIRKQEEEERARLYQIQMEKKRKQEEERLRQIRIAEEEQKRAHEAEMRRREEQQRKLQRQIAEERERQKREQEEAARRKKNIPIEKKVVREVERIGKKLFKW